MNKENLFKYGYDRYNYDVDTVKSIIREGGHTRFNEADWSVYVNLIDEHFMNEEAKAHRVRAAKLAGENFPESCPVCGGLVVLDPKKCKPAFRLRNRWKCVSDPLHYAQARAQEAAENLRILSERWQAAVDKHEIIPVGYLKERQ